MQGLSNKYLDLQRGTGVPSSGDPWNQGSFERGSRGRCPTWVFPTSDRGLVLFGPLILVEDGELWASDGVLEMMEPRALTFSQEELA
ncbi:hypothetical protein DY000_02052518 [Brassica cretica]|uniref:Uncharacterized protein n=1 Tax=Brassica cretica TaxID=69181 RepID=A0ABQ7AJY6_BRACR|nr:hypothetical protein DY000_02052518 [Brassica cretica]